MRGVCVAQRSRVLVVDDERFAMIEDARRTYEEAIPKAMAEQ